MKEHWKLIQQHLGLDADGIPGPRTAQALMEKLDIRQPEHSWPSPGGSALREVRLRPRGG